jgi:aspartate aminotransferase
MFSSRIEKMAVSLTLAMTAKARELKSDGKDILSFSAGEPDFDTPQIIKDAVIKAIQDGKTTYTAVGGIPELLNAIKDKLKRDNNLEYDAKNIVVSNGAKQSLFNLFAVLLNHEDEVIIPTPSWVSYPEMVKYHGAKPVFVETDEKNHFKLSAKQLQNAITKKTKILVLNSPSNPTGSIYSKDEILELADVLKGTDILVLSDEIYEKLVYDNQKFTAFASVSEDMFKRTITINGVSKSVAMTGWRMGYFATAIPEIAKAVIKLQGQSTSNINTPTQYGAIVALDKIVDNEIEKMRQAFEQRKNFAVQKLSEIENLSVINPGGAFYLFVNIKKIEQDSMKFCLSLLEDEGVATVPGVGFGSDGYFRFSYATDLKTIEEGIKRIKRFVENYMK